MGMRRKERTQMEEMSKEVVTYLFLEETLAFLSFREWIRDLHDLKEHRLLL
jgi:hypothetical protein